MKTHLFSLLLLCLLSLIPQRMDAQRFLQGAENKTNYEEDAEIHRLYKPLERPQIRFNVIHAEQSGDSCWVVIRISVPYQAVEKGERFIAKIFSEIAPATVTWEYSLNKMQGTPLDMSPGEIRCCYYSTKFAYTPRISDNFHYTISATIQNENYKYKYQPLTLPVYCHTFELEWEGADKLPRDIILNDSPVANQDLFQIVPTPK